MIAYFHCFFAYRMSDGKKKLSGNQFRKRRLKTEASVKKQAVTFETYFKSNSRPSVNERNPNDLYSIEVEEVVPTKQSSPVSALSSIAQVPDRVEQQGEEEKELEDASHLQMETDEDRFVTLSLSSDPGLWPECISDAERICLAKAGPASPMYNFDFLLIRADASSPQVTTQDISATERKFPEIGWCILKPKTQFSASSARFLQRLHLL